MYNSNDPCVPHPGTFESLTGPLIRSTADEVNSFATQFLTLPASLKSTVLGGQLLSYHLDLLKEVFDSIDVVDDDIYAYIRNNPNNVLVIPVAYTYSPGGKEGWKEAGGLSLFPLDGTFYYVDEEGREGKLYDVVVCGGGPSGSTVAGELKEKWPQLNVALFDSQTPTRAPKYIGLLPDAAKLFESPGDSGRTFGVRASVFSCKLSIPSLECAAAELSNITSVLLNAAKSRGVHVEKQKVSKVVFVGDQAIGVKLPDGSICPSHLIIDATRGYLTKTIPNYSSSIPMKGEYFSINVMIQGNSFTDDIYGRVIGSIQSPSGERTSAEVLSLKLGSDLLLYIFVPEEFFKRTKASQKNNKAANKAILKSVFQMVALDNHSYGGTLLRFLREDRCVIVEEPRLHENKIMIPQEHIVGVLSLVLLTSNYFGDGTYKSVHAAKKLAKQVASQFQKGDVCFDELREGMNEIYREKFPYMFMSTKLPEMLFYFLSSDYLGHFTRPVHSVLPFALSLMSKSPIVSYWLSSEFTAIGTSAERLFSASLQQLIDMELPEKRSDPLAHLAQLGARLLFPRVKAWEERERTRYEESLHINRLET